MATASQPDSAVVAYTSFQHDLFVSYAVADNGHPWQEQTPGWVQLFVAALEAEINRQITARGPVDVWFDRRRLTCGDSFYDEIFEALDASAVLVVLLSPQYLASPWCKCERETFRLACNVQKNEWKRIFVVALAPPAELPQPLPDGLAGSQQEKFWRQREKTSLRLGHPLPDPGNPNHVAFFEQTTAVACAIASRLDQFRQPANQSHERLAPPGPSRRGNLSSAPGT